MSWIELLKATDEDMKRMYIDATELISSLYEQTSEDMRFVDDFAKEYSDMVDKNPVEWPLMHDYLIKYLKIKTEERDLHRNVLKQLHEEVSEGF